MAALTRSLSADAPCLWQEKACNNNKCPDLWVVLLLQECIRLLSFASDPEPQKSSEAKGQDVVDLTGTQSEAGAAPEKPAADQLPSETAAQAAAVQFSLSRVAFDPTKIESYRQVLARQVKTSTTSSLVSQERTMQLSNVLGCLKFELRHATH